MIQTVLGLILNFVGAVLVAFSIKRGKVLIWKDSPREPEYTAVFKLGLFRWGVALLGLGFLLQLWGLAARA